MKKLLIFLFSISFGAHLAAQSTNDQVHTLLQHINVLCDGNMCLTTSERAKVFDYVRTLVSINPNALVHALDVLRKIGFTDGYLQREFVQLKGK